ncbi:hypothetical protein GCM10023116_47950 [Kistimonas scapharcae]|uniref:Uncharacterized protein n=1 Tax=Kistimonas scapharcae TaxID=1036133 RepID=A0ABP8V9E2_9GAMM
MNQSVSNHIACNLNYFRNIACHLYYFVHYLDEYYGNLMDISGDDDGHCEAVFWLYDYARAIEVAYLNREEGLNSPGVFVDDIAGNLAARLYIELGKPDLTTFEVHVQQLVNAYCAEQIHSDDDAPLLPRLENPYRFFIVRLRLHIGEYEKHTYHVIQARNQDMACIEALTDECHNEPCFDEFPDQRACRDGGEYVYRVQGIQEITPEQARQFQMIRDLSRC